MVFTLNMKSNTILIIHFTFFHWHVQLILFIFAIHEYYERQIEINKSIIA